MDDYISKPFQPEDIVAALNRLAGSGKIAHYDSAERTVSSSTGASPSETTAEHPVDEDSITERIFDTTELLARLDGKVELLPRFVDMFIKNTSGYLKALRLAVDAGNVEQIRTQAHSIKGAAANISAHTIEEIATALESSAKEGLLDESDHRMELLEKEFNEFYEVVSRYRS